MCNRSKWTTLNIFVFMLYQRLSQAKEEKDSILSQHTVHYGMFPSSVES